MKTNAMLAAVRGSFMVDVTGIIELLKEVFMNKGYSQNCVTSLKKALNYISETTDHYLQVTSGKDYANKMLKFA